MALLLAAVAAGLAVRVTGGFAVLLAGTTLAAAGAACGNVLLPVIVRRSFADRIGTMSALYTTALVGVAALSAGLTVPIAHAIGEGWRGGLASWALLALAALACGCRRSRRERGRPVAVAAARAHPRRHARAPDLAADRLLRACSRGASTRLVAWMPSIFESHGIGTTDAGFLLGLSGAMAVPAALFIPRLAARVRDQRGLAFWLTAVARLRLRRAAARARGRAGAVGGHDRRGQGACFPLALTMIVLRSGSPAVASSLSTHVQSIGYLLAAAGPLVGRGAARRDGLLDRDARCVLMAMLVPQALSGLGAGTGARRGRRSGIDLLARLAVDDADRARRAASAAASISSSGPVPMTTATSSRRKISGAMSTQSPCAEHAFGSIDRDERHVGAPFGEVAEAVAQLGERLRAPDGQRPRPAAARACRARRSRARRGRRRSSTASASGACPRYWMRVPYWSLQKLESAGAAGGRAGDRVRDRRALASGRLPVAAAARGARGYGS